MLFGNTMTWMSLGCRFILGVSVDRDAVTKSKGAVIRPIGSRAVDEFKIAI